MKVTQRRDAGVPVCIEAEGGARVLCKLNRVVIRAYEQVVLCACAACCWCATMRLVSWMKLSRFADEKLFGCG